VTWLREAWNVVKKYIHIFWAVVCMLFVYDKFMSPPAGDDNHTDTGKARYTVHGGDDVEGEHEKKTKGWKWWTYVRGKILGGGREGGGGGGGAGDGEGGMQEEKGGAAGEGGGGGGGGGKGKQKEEKKEKKEKKDD
jgi:hypothetical protein